VRTHNYNNNRNNNNCGNNNYNNNKKAEVSGKLRIRVENPCCSHERTQIWRPWPYLAHPSPPLKMPTPCSPLPLLLLPHSSTVVEFLLHFVCKCKCRLAFAHFKLVPGNRARSVSVRGWGRGTLLLLLLLLLHSLMRVCTFSTTFRGLILAPRHFLEPGNWHVFSIFVHFAQFARNVSLRVPRPQ